MRFIAVTAVAVAALAAAGCGAGSSGQSAPTPATGAAGSTTVAAATTAVSADQAAFVAALDAIDKDIAHGKAEKAYDRGRNQCDSIKNNPNDRAKLLDLTRQRFTSPDHPEGFPPATVEKILDAVKTHLCP
ncbi:hypothetical protein JNUCC0626_13715 [Lentzea sp. JNUCC 0626]|uniref:hypothetical protein n=1 Tax=Lentzea sp. JNUCC 0626 TaxID=3367513 RepID=UPI0037492BC4